jgi:SsrA-binding protein
MVVFLENRKARFDYEIVEKFTGGIELLGQEVKSLRSKQGSLEGSYITIRGNEAYLIEANIPPFQPKNIPKGYDQRRVRRILLTKKEIAKLAGFEKQKGLTIIPISVYSKGRWMKVDMAVARGKKKHDKRETIKKRDTEREIRREFKDR